MWLFTKYGFFSVTVNGVGEMLLRTRRQEHLLRLKKAFPGKRFGKIVKTPERDYPFRMTVDPKVLGAVVTEMLTGQTYSNFKNEVERVHGRQSKYAETLHRIWRDCLAFEDREQNEW